MDGVLGWVDGEAKVVKTGFGLQKYWVAVEVRREELSEVRKVCGTGRKEGESVVDVPGGEKATECEVLGLAMFDVVSNVTVCVDPRLLAHCYHHVTKSWAGGGAHGSSSGLL